VKQHVKRFLRYLLETPDVNSRFVFLMHSAALCLCTIALCIAFIAAKNKEPYPTMVLALSGGGTAAAALGRGITKAGNWMSTNSQPEPPVVDAPPVDGGVTSEAKDKKI